MEIKFFKHNIGDAEFRKVREVINSQFLTTGNVVNEFEDNFAKYLNAKHCIGTTSCTAALHLSLLAFGIEKGDEVITTPLSFVATSNAILFTGAKPVFVDVEEETGNIDADLIERAITKKTKAILPVHLYGQMADMKKIKKIASKYKIKVIEDAAHCIEGERDGVVPGQLGDAACFSFYATKNITSGEGGAVVTNNAYVADLVKKLRLHGITSNAADRYFKKYKHYDMEMLGWKYNMSNIQAALLLNQLKFIKRTHKKREIIARRYEKKFNKMRNIDFPKTLSKSARHLFTIWVDPSMRDDIVHKLQDKGVGVAVNYRPIHLMEYYRSRFGYKNGAYPIAEQIGKSTITLPLYPKLKNEEVDYVIEQVRQIVNG